MILGATFSDWFTYKINRAKKMIFLSTTASLSRNQDRRGEAAVAERINEIFHLCQDKKAESLRFPYRVSSIVWGNKVIYKQLLSNISSDQNTGNAIELAQSYVKESPKWMRYASIETMANDVMTLMLQARDVLKINRT